MNKFLKISVALVAALGLTACVQDLNQTPIDKNSAATFNQAAVFTKCYATLGLTGQKGAAGNGDIDDLDEGTSGFYRLFWALNEYPTDDGWWIWNDVGLADIRVMSWDGDNELVKGLYYRLNIDIKFCNHYLTNCARLGTLDDNEEHKHMTAEVRFLRALHTWYLLDMFYVVPFTTEDVEPFVVRYPTSGTPDLVGPNSSYPPFLTRPQLYKWLVEELEDVCTLLPATQANVYRVRRAAAELLLARLYLNADVYNKDNDPEWSEESYRLALQKAVEHAQICTNNRSVELLSDSVVTPTGFVYSAYQTMFMGDNDRTFQMQGADPEALLLVYQDGNYSQSYAGIQYVIAATRTGSMVPWGISTQWTCFRTSPELVKIFGGTADIKANEYEMRHLLKDDRAIFCSFVAGNSNTWTLTGGMAANFYTSWAGCKFNAVYAHKSNDPSDVNGTSSDWPDTDIPLLRMAEAYLIDAEATARLQNNFDNPQTRSIINDKIRKRANAEPLTRVTVQELCNEWAREFWFEGMRRNTLIRFNRFAGPQADQANYTWEGRNGKGNAYSSVENYRNWYPVPSDDKKSNPNYGTQIRNTTPYQDGDGYAY